MKRMKKLLYAAIALLMIIFGGCSSSKITSSWNDKNSIENPVKFNKIIVVGLFDDNNRALRRQMEEQLAQQLRNEGFNAVTSVSVYGPKSFENVSEEKALKIVKDKNIDGVITIGLIDKTKDTMGDIIDKAKEILGFEPISFKEGLQKMFTDL